VTRPLLRTCLIRALLASGSLLLLAAGVEVWSRAADPYGISYYRDFNRYLHEAIELVPFEEQGRLFRHRAGLDLELTTFRLRTDALGLREGEPRASRDDEGEMRILCLGDSTTLGWGVDDGDTWVRHLEREARAMDGRAVQAFNAGHNVYDTVQELALLRELGPLLAPQLVLVMVNTNDLDPTVGVYREMVAAGIEGGQLSSLARSWAWARHAISRRFLGLAGLMQYWGQREVIRRVAQRDFDITEESSYPGGLPRMLDALEGMGAACEELGARLVVLDHTFPAVPELPEWCADRGLPCLDLQWSDAEWALDIRNSEADAHSNPLGNRLMAEKVMAGLTGLEILSE